MKAQPHRGAATANVAMPKDPTKQRSRRRFSVLYFAIIYLYTLFFGLLETIPFLESLLSHLPQPHHLVSDTYQPISDRSAPTTPEHARPDPLLAFNHTFTLPDPNPTAAGAIASLPQRRRRASSSSSATSSNNVATPSSVSGTSGGVSTAAAAARTAKRKTLVLDLDETLIHSSPQGSYRAHHRIEVVIDKVACLYYVYKRPHVDYFLRRVSEWYKVVVFTASLAEYADPVIDLLDSQNKLIEGRYFRESCVPHDSSYAKDLAAIDPDLSQIVLVDNSPLSYFINPTNGIPIQPWVNSDPKDEALLDLLPLLDALRFTDDVRSILSLRLV
ncbi:Nuclear envelope morphology protein 1 [Coemansia sp. BCRC 34301]|nr:Nuclear envelope morphology protein 1 [Coemansia sp. BCRC 34301]